jgi:fatty-acyl-CoA synthase
VDLIKTGQVTVVGGVPPIWLGVKEICEREGRNISSICCIPLGGSAAPKSLIKAYDKQFGARILHAQGMTETTPIGTVSRLKSYMEAWPEAQQYAVRAKQDYAAVGVDLRLVDE